MTTFNPEKSETPYASAVTFVEVNLTPAARRGKESRLAVRKKLVHGRVNVSMPRGLSTFGKLVDISLHGVGVMLNAPIASNTVCSVECQLLLNGNLVFLSVRATSVHCVLVSHKGFRVGLQFEPLEANAVKIINDVLV